MNKLQGLEAIKKKYTEILEEAEDTETITMCKGVLHEVNCLILSYKEKLKPYYGDPID